MFTSLRLVDSEVERAIKDEYKKCRLERLRMVKEQSKQFERHLRKAYNEATHDARKKLCNKQKENIDPTPCTEVVQIPYGEGIINAALAENQYPLWIDEEQKKINQEKAELRGKKALKEMLRKQQDKFSKKLLKLEKARTIEKVRSKNIVALGKLRDLFEDNSLIITSATDKHMHPEGNGKEYQEHHTRLRAGECLNNDLIEKNEDAKQVVRCRKVRFVDKNNIDEAQSVKENTKDVNRNQIVDFNNDKSVEVEKQVGFRKKHVINEIVPVKTVSSASSDAVAPFTDAVMQASEYEKQIESERKTKDMIQRHRNVEAKRRGSKAMNKEKVCQKYSNLLFALDELDRENNLEDLFSVEEMYFPLVDELPERRDKFTQISAQKQIESLNWVARLPDVSVPDSVMKTDAQQSICIHHQDEKSTFNERLINSPDDEDLISGNFRAPASDALTYSNGVHVRPVPDEATRPSSCDGSDNDAPLNSSDKIRRQIDIPSSVKPSPFSSCTIHGPSDIEESTLLPNDRLHKDKPTSSSSLTFVSSLSFKEIMKELLRVSVSPPHQPKPMSTSSSTNYLSLPEELLERDLVTKCVKKSRPIFKIPPKGKIKSRRRAARSKSLLSSKPAVKKNAIDHGWKSRLLQYYIQMVLKMKPQDIRNLSVSSVSSVGSAFSITMMEDEVRSINNKFENDLDLKKIHMEGSLEDNSQEEMAHQSPSGSSSDSSFKHSHPIGSESVETVLPSMKGSELSKPTVVAGETVNVHDFLNSAQWDAFLKTMCQNILRNKTLSPENEAPVADESAPKEELEKASDASLGFGTEKSFHDSKNSDFPKRKRSDGVLGKRKSGGDDFESHSKTYWKNNGEEISYHDVDHISNEKYGHRGAQSESSPETSSRRHDENPFSDHQSSSYFSSKDFETYSDRPSTPLPVADVQSVVTEIYSAYKKLKKILDVSLKTSVDGNSQSSKHKGFVKDITFKDKGSRSRTKSKGHQSHMRSRTCGPPLRRNKVDSRHSDENMTTVEIFRKKTCHSPVFSKFAAEEKSSSEKPFSSHFKINQSPVCEKFKGKHVQRESKKLLSDIVSYKYDKHKPEEMLPKSESAPPLKSNSNNISFNRSSRHSCNIKPGSGMYQDDHEDGKDVNRRSASDSQKLISSKTSRPRHKKPPREKSNTRGSSARKSGKKVSGDTNHSQNDVDFSHYNKNKHNRKSRLNRSSDQRHASSDAAELLNSVFNKLASGLLRGDGSCINCSRNRDEWLSPTSSTSVISTEDSISQRFPPEGERFNESSISKGVPAKNLQRQFEEMAKALKFDGYIKVDDNMESLSEFSSMSDRDQPPPVKPPSLKKDPNECFRVREFQNWVAGIQEKALNNSRLENLSESQKKIHAFKSQTSCVDDSFKSNNFGNISSITMASHQDYKLSSYSSEGSIEENVDYDKNHSSRVVKSSSFKMSPTTLHPKDNTKSSVSGHDSSGSKRMMYSLEPASSSSFNMR